MRSGSRWGQPTFLTSGRPRTRRSPAGRGRWGAHVPASALTTPGVPVFSGAGAQQTIKQNAPPLEIPQVGEALELETDIVDVSGSTAAA